MSLLVAIVILNWNGRKFLETYLPSVVKHSQGSKNKIFVVDNNSTDDSVEFVKQNFQTVEVVQFIENHGFAGGYARCLPDIDSKYYVLLNSDVEVTENWLDPLVETLERDPLIAAAMPKLKASDDRKYFEYAGAAGGFIDKYGYPFCQGRILSNIEEDKGQYNNEREIFWASGACMFIRAEAYLKSGGLDEDFFAHMEEIDLCWRLKSIGYKIVVCPESEVYHVGGGTLPNDNPRKLYYNYRNSLYLLMKNLNTKNIPGVLLSRMALDCISSLLYLLQGRFAFFISVIRAHCRFIINLSGLLRKRRTINKIRTTKTVDQIYPKSIVFSFFIKGKKYFSDLVF